MSPFIAHKCYKPGPQERTSPIERQESPIWRVYMIFGVSQWVWEDGACIIGKAM
jgi:hypothetical protein